MYICVSDRIVWSIKDVLPCLGFNEGLRATASEPFHMEALGLHVFMISFGNHALQTPAF